MAEICYPFTSVRTEDAATGEVTYDRAVSAETLRQLFQRDRSNGVITMNDTTALQVTQTTTPSMQIWVRTGFAFINGATYSNTDIYAFTVPTAHATYNRYDAVVLRLDTAQDQRRIYLRYQTGTASASPTRYTPVRSGTIYELVLAHILVIKGASSISNQYITDLRQNTTYCGISIPYQSIDTTG